MGISAAAAAYVGSISMTFVGPAQTPALRASQRTPSVEMGVYGNEGNYLQPDSRASLGFDRGYAATDGGGTTTGTGSEKTVYVLFPTIVFFASILANTNGFFGPW